MATDRSTSTPDPAANLNDILASDDWQNSIAAGEVDAAEIVADCLDVMNDEDHPEGHALVFATSILKALRGAGWRIVRTEVDDYDGETINVMEEWTGGA